MWAHTGEDHSGEAKEYKTCFWFQICIHISWMRVTEWNKEYNQINCIDSFMYCNI